MTTEVLPPVHANPKRDPDWTFTSFIPGKPMAKGSPQPKTIRRGGQPFTFMVDRPDVMAWVAKVAGIATRDRMQRQAQGDKSFPYEAPIELRCLFVYPRPATQPTGPPIIHTGKYAVGDLDKLVRAIGDALTSGAVNVRNGNERSKTAKAAVIIDDSRITKIWTRKAFSDEGYGLEPGVYIKLLHAPEETIDMSFYV
jgi:Holliday junction resolvase RusA-like endonuclease